MITLVLNLTLALLASVLILLTIPEQPWSPDAPYILSVLIKLCWLAGAIGLLSRKQWAWWASVVGVGYMFSSSVALFVVGVRLFPIAQDPPDGIGFMVIKGAFGLLFATPVLIGLFLMRRAWARCEGTAEEPEVPSENSPKASEDNSGGAEG